MQKFWKFWWFKASYLTFMSSFVLLCLAYALWPVKVFLWTGIELAVILITLSIFIFGSLHQARSKNQSTIGNRGKMKAANVMLLASLVVTLASVVGCFVVLDSTSFWWYASRALVIGGLFMTLWSLIFGTIRSVGTI